MKQKRIVETAGRPLIHCCVESTALFSNNTEVRVLCAFPARVSSTRTPLSVQGHRLPWV
jgi:hypothetical protein